MEALNRGLKQKEINMTPKEARTIISKSCHSCLINVVKGLYNCHEAEINDNGYVWISNPQRGHWISNDQLCSLAEIIQEAQKDAKSRANPGPLPPIKGEHV